MIHEVKGANSYLLLNKEEVAVIDTGMPGNALRIIAYVKTLGRDPASIKWIVLTHSDIDHSGSAAELKRLTNAEVAIHKLDAPRLSGEMKRKETKGAMGIIFSMMSPFMRFTPVKADVLLEDSSEIAGLTVIHTPGHTEGSISLYQPEEALFVGDALRTSGQGLFALPSESMSVNVGQGMDSVRNISELRFTFLLPGHGPPITSDASTKLREFVTKGFKNE